MKNKKGYLLSHSYRKNSLLENIIKLILFSSTFAYLFSLLINIFFITGEANNFSLGFGNDEKLLDDEETDGFSSSPSFEVYEKIEVNQGMFIATRQAANTFYHQVAPSKTVTIHRDLVKVHDFPITKITKSATFLDTFMAFSRKTLVMRVNWRGTMSTLVQLIAPLHTFWSILGNA